MASQIATPGTSVVFNGIDGDTGSYLFPPIGLAELAAGVRKSAVDPAAASLGKALQEKHLGIADDANPENLPEVGWAVVFHEQEEAAVKAALAPLMEHRRKVVGDPDLVKELTYRTGEDRAKFLAKYKVTAGNVKPRRVPYYLLLVGSPEKIPFSFGYLLDIEYAVGRIHFDTPAEYAQYAQGVIDYETATKIKNKKDALFFAPRHDGDAATQMSHDGLVTPIVKGRSASRDEDAKPPIPKRMGFQATALMAEDAVRKNLSKELKSGTAPSIFFSASHGMGFKNLDDAKQIPYQGALVCQDFELGAVKRNDYLAGEDLDGADLGGMIAFLFACYGAGTPATARYNYLPGVTPPKIANADFFATLPKKMLTSGTLACIGHIERAWAWSLRGAGSDQIVCFENYLTRVMRGSPVGHAIRDFNERYSVLSADLSHKLDPQSGEPEVDADLLAKVWCERNDAESYVVFGDPAVRLRIADMA